MDKNQKEKLLRYLRNASPFFWGIFPGNKDDFRKRLADLQLKCDLPPKATYASLLENIIELNGLDAIIKAIKDQMTQVLFTRENLERLRRHWVDGRSPDIAYLRRYQLLDSAKLLLEVNIQFDYVGGWTSWAGIWFEEIEPWVKG